MRLSGGRLKRSEPAVEQSREGTVIAGRYKVMSEIGRGGMGVVYRVLHVHTGEPLALKLLVGVARTDALAVKRFKREGQTSARIQSEHVVRVIDADVSKEDDTPFLVMELLTGMNVETYVRENGAVEPESLIALFAQVGAVLETAHALGIVHRDLKPENLFLHRRKDGTTLAKVLDFGISKFSAEETHDTAKTATGSVIGTPLYMSPEQAHGHNDKIAATTDVWAMGLIAMRLLAGEHYWGAPTMADLMMKIAVLPIAPPSERWPNGKHMSPALDAWFLRSCDRDQSQRWPSVAEQVRELAKVFGLSLPAHVSSPLPLLTSERVSDTETGGQTISATTTAARRARARSPWPIAFGIAAAAGCVAVAFTGRGPSPTPASSSMPQPVVSPPASASVARSVAPIASAAPPAPAPPPSAAAPRPIAAKPVVVPTASAPPLYAPLAP